MGPVAGVDGCRGGWLAVSLPGLVLPGKAQVALSLAGRWRDLALDGHFMISVDMPIGLAERGPRACDIAARRVLPRRHKSSVFPPPRRHMLGCADWAEANALGRAREGKGLSRQAWNITPKIKDLDECLRPEDQDRIREVHPELVFHRLAGGTALPAKRKAAGRSARLALLGRAGLEGLEPLLRDLPKAEAGPDDLLDAAACALAARCILAGTASRLPANPPRDARGLRMEIWY